MTDADRAEHGDDPARELPAAETVPRRSLPRQVGGIWFPLGVAIGFVAGVALVVLATGAISWERPQARLDVVLPLLLLAAIVLTCVRRTCSFGLGALVSVLFTPIFAIGFFLEAISSWG